MVDFDSAGNVVKKCSGEKAEILTEDDVALLTRGFYDAYVKAIAERIGIHRDAATFYARIATMVRTGADDSQ